MLYLDFATQEELDSQYDVSRNLKDAASSVTRIPWSEAARQQLPHYSGLRYGSLPEETLDIFPGIGNATPAVVYFHGGYWSTPELVKERYSWAAHGFRAHGFATFVVDYGVCPDYTIGELVAQAQRAVAWVYANAESYGASASKIYVVGHSAGGHLAAMLALTDWAGLFGLPNDLVKGICPISGLFDLRPFPHTWLAPKLRLTSDEISKNSPLFFVRPQAAPMLLSYGAEEPSEFHRQSAEMRGACEKAGVRASLLPVPGVGHTSVINGLADPGSVLCHAIANHVEETTKARA